MTVNDANVTFLDDLEARQPARRRFGRPDLGRLVAYAFLILLMVFYIGPLLMLFMTAFKTLPEFTKDAT